MSSKFNSHNLRTQTDTQIWLLCFSSILTSHNHTLYSSIAKSSWQTYTIHIIKNCCTIFFYIFCFDKTQANFYILMEARNFKSLIERIIRIFQIYIFTNHSYAYFFLGSLYMIVQIFPSTHICSLIF